MTSEVIADRKEPLASEVIAEQKTQAASEIQEAEPEVQAVPEGESHPSGQLSVEAEKQETALNGEGTQQGENLSPVQTLASQNTQADRAEFAAQEESVTTMTVRQPEEIPQKLTEQLLVKTARGVNEFEIHIEPVNLGKIAIKILYEQGQTTISILCSEKKTMELVGQNARDIGNVMEQNLGGTTTIILDKQDTDYLNQERNDNGQAEREAQQEKQKEEGRKHKAEDAEQFLQKLRLGLAI